MSANYTALHRYLRTPKGLFALVLLLLTAVAGTFAGWSLVATGLAGAMIAAALVDVPIARLRTGAWVNPDGAVLTGCIVALVLSPHEPWHVAAITAVVAVLAKHAFRVGRANVFNPAAFGLVATFYLFDTGHSWWGALPELPLPWIVLLLATGFYTAMRVNKVPLVLAFLGSYYTLITASAFIGDPASVAELYRAPDLHAALFFAAFMLTDPPTSPPKQRDQLTCGVIAAVVGFAVFEVIGAAYFLLAGLLVANVWEGWRKRRVVRRKGRVGVVA